MADGQWKLTETEMRELAFKYASQKITRTSINNLNEEWFAEFMSLYNQIMNVADQYNQKVKD